MTGILYGERTANRPKYLEAEVRHNNRYNLTALRAEGELHMRVRFFSIKKKEVSCNI
jgi:hypothetical protein